MLCCIFDLDTIMMFCSWQFTICLVMGMHTYVKFTINNQYLVRHEVSNIKDFWLVAIKIEFVAYTKTKLKNLYLVATIAIKTRSKTTMNCCTKTIMQHIRIWGEPRVANAFFVYSTMRKQLQKKPKTHQNFSRSRPCYGEINGVDYSISNGRHKIRECWFSGLVAPIHSVVTVVILPSKNVLDL